MTSSGVFIFGCGELSKHVCAFCAVTQQLTRRVWRLERGADIQRVGYTFTYVRKNAFCESLTVGVRADRLSRLSDLYLSDSKLTSRNFKKEGPRVGRSVPTRGRSWPTPDTTRSTKVNHEVRTQGQHFNGVGDELREALYAMCVSAARGGPALGGGAARRAEARLQTPLPL